MDDEPRSGSALSLRVQVAGWLLGINLLVFLGGGIWLRGTILEVQEGQARRFFDDLMYMLRDSAALAGEINVSRILQDPKWAGVEDAMIIDKSYYEVAGQIVNFGVALNPVGAAERRPAASSQEILRGLVAALETGTPVEVAGGRAIRIEDKSGPWGAFWYRAPESFVEQKGAVERLLPWFLISTLLLTGGSFLLLSRLAIEPVRRIARGVRRIEAGDLTARVPTGGGSEELDGLMRGFNAMAARVERLQEQMTGEVARATDQALQAEKAVLTQKRLAAMGELTAGIAHEINNPLGGLLNAAQALERGDLSPERRARYIGLLRDGLERIRDTVGGLLRFTPRETQAATVDLLAVVRDSLALVRHRAGQAGVELAVEFDRDVPEGTDEPSAFLVFGARNELGQALLNLLVNALDALDENEVDAPRVTVRLALVERRVEGAQPDRWRRFVRVVIADNGPGVDAALLERVSDLFFTTKEVGKGTGLGLGIVHRIVDAHDGEISLESAPGKGFVVTIDLPGRASA